MTVRLILALSLGFVVAAAASQPPADPASPFPAGTGRDALIKVCGGCHGAESAVAQFKTHDEWVKTLEEMGNNGAQASDQEWEQIQGYLDKNFSYIFVNRATAKELEAALDVSADAADAVVRRRTEKGPFTSIDDLKAVPGLAAAALDARKDRFIF